MIFSINRLRWHKWIFNLIAPMYGALDKYVKKGYSRAINNISEVVDLNEKSVVFDIGGYNGQWTSEIFSKYCCAFSIFPLFSSVDARASR